MNIIVKANAEKFEEVKDGMCEALIELMKDEIENEANKKSIDSRRDNSVSDSISDGVSHRVSNGVGNRISHSQMRGPHFIYSNIEMQYGGLCENDQPGIPVNFLTF